MIGYIIQKLAYGLAVLAGIICIVFFLFSVLPGDAAQMTMGQRADVQSLESVKYTSSNKYNKKLSIKMYKL